MSVIIDKVSSSYLWAEHAVLLRAPGMSMNRDSTSFNPFSPLSVSPSSFSRKGIGSYHPLASTRSDVVDGIALDAQNGGFPEA